MRDAPPRPHRLVVRLSDAELALLERVRGALTVDTASGAVRASVRATAVAMVRILRGSGATAAAVEYARTLEDAIAAEAGPGWRGILPGAPDGR